MSKPAKPFNPADVSGLVEWWGPDPQTGQIVDLLRRREFVLPSSLTIGRSPGPLTDEQRAAVADWFRTRFPTEPPPEPDHVVG